MKTLHLILGLTFGSWFIGFLVAHYRLGFSDLNGLLLSTILIPIWFLFYRYFFSLDKTPKDRTSKLPITSGNSG